MRNDPRLEAYFEHFSTPLPEVLLEVERLTHLRTVWPSMMSSRTQLRLLAAVSRMIAPHRILEIGTFTGASAIAMATGLTGKGELVTLESNDEYEPLLRNIFEKAGITRQVHLIIGKALEVLPLLKGPFDLVFIDADKREYPEYLDRVVPLTREGGWILADNVLWDGKVLKDPEKMDAETRAIHLFNRKVTDDPQLENFILPVRDGIMFIRKK